MMQMTNMKDSKAAQPPRAPPTQGENFFYAFLFFVAWMK